jgi:hypothetical protein
MLFTRADIHFFKPDTVSKVSLSGEIKIRLKLFRNFRVLVTTFIYFHMSSNKHLEKLVHECKQS